MPKNRQRKENYIMKEEKNVKKNTKIVGKILIDSFKPSFTPSIKILKISIFLYKPYIIINKAIIGGK